MLFKSLTNDKDKREYLASFMLDPASGGSIKNTIERSVAEETTTRVLWVTEEQYSGPMFLNSKEHAKLALEGEPSRPHENKKLADKGVLQFRVELTEEAYKKVLKESAELSKQADLTAEEYAPVATVMSDAAMSGPASSSSGKADACQIPATKKRRRAGKLQQHEDTPASADARASEDNLAKELADLKKFHDRSKKELDEARIIEQRLRAKNWGKEAIEYLKTAVDATQMEIGKAFQVWADHKGKQFSDNSARDDACKAAARTLASAKQKYDAFKSETLNDFLKFKK